MVQPTKDVWFENSRFLFFFEFVHESCDSSSSLLLLMSFIFCFALLLHYYGRMNLKINIKCDIHKHFVWHFRPTYIYMDSLPIWIVSSRKDTFVFDWFELKLWFVVEIQFFILLLNKTEDDNEYSFTQSKLKAINTIT